MKQLNHNVNCDEAVLPINDRKHSIIDLVQSYIRPLKFSSYPALNVINHFIHRSAPVLRHRSRLPPCKMFRL